MGNHEGKKKNNKLYVIKAEETEIDSDDLLAEYENLCEDEQKLLDKRADITQRKEEIKSMLNGALKEVEDEEKKNKIKNKLNSAEPGKSRPTKKRKFNK